MNCTEFSNLLDAYLDGDLAPEEKARVEEHAAACAECGALLTLRRDCRELDEQIQVPASFSESWRQAIRREAEKEQKAQRKRTVRSVLTAAAALVFVVGGTLATRKSGLVNFRRTGQTPAATEAPAPEMMLSIAPSDASKPAVYATGLPAMDVAAEEANAESDAGVWAAKQAPQLEPLSAESAASNEVFGARNDNAAEEAEEDGRDMAALCEDAAEGAAEDAAYPLMAAQEGLAEPAPMAAQEAPQEAAEDAAAESAAQEAAEDQASFALEAGTLALCALPWLGLVILAWLVARRIRKRKKERK